MRNRIFKGLETRPGFLGEKLIAAVDFDGTLAITDYPDILRPNLTVIEWVKEFREAGNIVILNTCRHDKDLMDAMEWCIDQGLVIDFVNENVPEVIAIYGDCRKIAADIYIDDHAIHPNWLE